MSLVYLWVLGFRKKILTLILNSLIHGENEKCPPPFFLPSLHSHHSFYPEFHPDTQSVINLCLMTGSVSCPTNRINNKTYIFISCQILTFLLLKVLFDFWGIQGTPAPRHTLVKAAFVTAEWMASFIHTHTHTGEVCFSLGSYCRSHSSSVFFPVEPLVKLVWVRSESDPWQGLTLSLMVPVVSDILKHSNWRFAKPLSL